MQKSRKVTRVVYGRPHVYIGKSGLTEGVLAEIWRHLEEEGAIKVRIARSLINFKRIRAEALAEEVAKAVNARVVDVRGNTFVLIKTKKGAAGGT